MTSDHCRVTVQRLFSNFFLIAWNVQKRCLTVSRRSRDLRPLSRDRSATFLKFFSNCLKRPKNVVWQSADGRVTSTTVAWPFSDFFQNFPKSLETSKKRCLTVGRRSRDPNHFRVTVQRLFSKISQIAWNVQKTLFDSQPTVAWPPTTVAWPFSDFFQIFFLIAWNVQKTLFDSRPTVAWPQPLSRDRSATFFKIFPNRLKRRKNVVWQSADGRVTPTTFAWPFSDFFQNFPKSLETSKKRCLTVGRRSRDLRPLSRDRSATFFKFFSNCSKRPKTLFDSQPTVAWPPTNVAWPFSDFFQIFF